MIDFWIEYDSLNHCKIFIVSKVDVTMELSYDENHQSPFYRKTIESNSNNEIISVVVEIKKGEIFYCKVKNIPN